MCTVHKAHFYVASSKPRFLLLTGRPPVCDEDIWESWGVAPFICNLGQRYRQVVNFKIGPFQRWGESPLYPLKIGVFLGGGGLSFERGSSGPHSVESSLWKRLWTCRKTLLNEWPKAGLFSLICLTRLGRPACRLVIIRTQLPRLNFNLLRSRRFPKHFDFKQL
jgi:hypothetical protein